MAARGKGRKPIVGWEPSDAEQFPDQQVPPDFKGWMGPYDPGYMRYYMGGDEHGPVLKFVKPIEPKPPLRSSPPPEAGNP
jgi:hypothetical protein